MTRFDVCVVGSFMMDLVVTAPRRPGPGETIIGHGMEQLLGGKGFNQAIAAARSGARVAMVGGVGDDDFGAAFLAALDREGIDASGVRVIAGVGTGVAVPLVEDSGENSIVIIPRANHEMTAADVAAASKVIEDSAVVLVQWELPVDAVVEAARIGRAASAVVVLNPAPAVLDIASFTGLVDIVVPNEHELVAMDTDAPGLRARTGASSVVVTLGQAGVVVDDDSGAAELAAHTVDCIDTVGAGDAFCGALAARLAAGDSLVDAARYGNAAGALAVTVRGAEPAMPMRVDIERMLGS